MGFKKLSEQELAQLINSADELIAVVSGQLRKINVETFVNFLNNKSLRKILDVTNGVDFDSLEDGAYDIKGSFELFSGIIPLNSGDILIKDGCALTIICKYGSYYIEDYNADDKIIRNSYLPDRNELDEVLDAKQNKLTHQQRQQIASMAINDTTESTVQTYSSQKIKNMISNILEFKIISTEDEFAEIFSFDENGNANWNCRTMYAILNSFLGAELYPSDCFVEFMMLGIDPELEITEQMEIIGSLATVNFGDFVTQEQLKDELNSRATHYDYGGHGNTLQLKDNTEFHWGNMSELTIMLPYSAGMFHSTVVFDSPSPATILTAPARIEFVGDDCTDGVLVPAENTSYEIDIKLVSVSKILAKVTAFPQNQIKYANEVSKETINNGQTVHVQDNTEYKGANLLSLTLQYPTDDFECFLSLSFADEGDITVILPESRYIGSAPVFANGEMWELSIKNGVVVGGKVE